jgi:hypothetical protein
MPVASTAVAPPKRVTSGGYRDLPPGNAKTTQKQRKNNAKTTLKQRKNNAKTTLKQR